MDSYRHSLTHTCTHSLTHTCTLPPPPLPPPSPPPQAGNNVIRSSSSLLTSAKSLAMNPRDPPTWQLLTSHSKALADAMKNLLMAIRSPLTPSLTLPYTLTPSLTPSLSLSHREGCPGQKECDQAIDTLNSTMTQLNQAVLAAMSQQLQPSAASTLQGFQVRPRPLYQHHH